MKTLRNLLAWATLSLLFTVACSDRPDYPRRPIPKDLLSDSGWRTAGQSLFAEKCSACHGKQGEGHSERAAFFDPPAPNFDEAIYREADPAYLYWRIANGKTVEPYLSLGSVMPAWGQHLSEEQIWQLVAYLKSRAE